MSDEHRAYPILYVDDEPQNLATFRYVLEQEFTVLTAPSGVDAVQVLERQDVAVLVCDQRMPGMSGIEVCRRARELRPNTARIILTAYADVQAAMDAINQGQVLRFMTKPWRNDEMIEVLHSAIELVRMRRLVQEMQTRILRGGRQPPLEMMARQVAAELEVPVARLRMNAEQVQDLLAAGLSTWDSVERARELVQHAQETQRDSQPPLRELSKMVQKLAAGQKPQPLPADNACDVGRVLRATASILSPVLEPAVRLFLEAHAAPMVLMAPADLGQVFVHLIMNAAQAMESSSPAHGATIKVELRQTLAIAEIAVVDSGPGISSGLSERIFDAGYTTREGAAGLGLALVRHLLAQASGTISAENQSGAGARFVVRLPAIT